MAIETPWIANPSATSDVAMRLFCLPYAGGAASIFYTWAKRFAAGVQLCPIELPGRGTRLQEPLRTSLDGLVEDLADAIGPYLDVPYAMLGHSMGATIAVRLALCLERMRLPRPKRLFLMGARPPHLPRPKPWLHQLDDAELADRLRSFGGTPEPVLQHPELMGLLLPILRADFQLIETFSLPSIQPLASPISGAAGEDDTEVSHQEMELWREYTRAEFVLRSYPGNHFFPWTCTDEVIRDLGRSLKGEGCPGTRSRPNQAKRRSGTERPCDAEQ